MMLYVFTCYPLVLYLLQVFKGSVYGFDFWVYLFQLQKDAGKQVIIFLYDFGKGFLWFVLGCHWLKV